MNKRAFLFLLVVLTTLSGFSQKKQKIKGSRIVSNKITEIEAFERIVIGEGFKIKLTQGLTPSVEINADDNLHEIIEFTVQNGSLKFNMKQRITSSKQLEIIISATDKLNTIELSDDAEISDLSSLKTTDLTLITKGSSKAFLTLRTNLFKLINGDKSSVQLNITADTVTLELTENCKTEALINATTTKIDMYQNSIAKIEGNTTNLELRLDNTAKFKGQRFTVENCVLTTETKAEAIIEVTKTLSIEAKGYTQTDIYGTAKIDLKALEDHAVLRKK